MIQFDSVEDLELTLQEIKNRGFIPSKRKGATGIGFTLESELGLTENNLMIPDMGEIELKSSRKNANSLITLFTWDRDAWIMSQREAIQKYGLKRPDGRINLYKTLSGDSMDADLLQTIIGDDIVVVDQRGQPLVSWSIKSFTQKFHQKLRHLLIVYADVQKQNNLEYFWYNEATFFSSWMFSRMVRALILNSIVTIDLRLHIKSDGSLRNHGTGFRIASSDLHHIYQIAEPLIKD